MVMRKELFACKIEHLRPFLVHAVSRIDGTVVYTCISAISKTRQSLMIVQTLKLATLCITLWQSYNPT